MKHFLLKAIVLFTVIVAGIGQAHAGPFIGPGGVITFSGPAVPVPVNATVGLLVLTLALGAVGAVALRRRRQLLGLFALAAPAALLVLLLAVSLAPQGLRAVSGPPELIPVNGPGAISFSFPFGLIAQPQGQAERDFFSPVRFQNQSGQTLRISGLEIDDCFDDRDQVNEETDRGVMACEVGSDLAPDAECAVSPPICELQPGV